MRSLIIGTDGTIGRPLFRELRRRGADVVATTRRRDHAESSGLLFFDLATSDARDLPGEIDVVVICAAMTSFAECRAAPEIARIVNLATPVSIAERYVADGGKVIFLSSAAVFDATIPFVPADAPHSPRGLYGRLKSEAESRLLALGQRVSVLRPTKVLAPEMPLFNQWIAALARGASIEAFVNHHISPIGIDDVVSVIIDVMRLDQGGVFQLSGAADISYASIARHVAACLGAPAHCVVPIQAERYIPADDVAAFNTLDAGRLQSLLGFDPPDPIRVLDEVFAPALAAVARQRVMQ
jgi:dTDP-4-dehydrorhamnose reductase